MLDKATTSAGGAAPSSAILDVAIIGAGFSGLFALHRMLGQNRSVRVFEAGSGVGGTWFWNRYPGARCDVESMEYSYSFSDEIQQEWRWSHHYAEQPEILSYLNFVADKLELRPHITFGTRVLSQTYDAERQLWTIETDTGETVEARFCIMASGNLSIPRVPDFPGIGSFRGEWYHTGQWPTEGVDFSGRRVGLIGTGATGIQIVPRVAPQAKHIHVFQRTANFSVPARNRPLSDEIEQWYKSNYPERRQAALKTNFGISNVTMPTRSALEPNDGERDAAFEERWQMGGSPAFQLAFNDLLVNIEANDKASEFVRRKIRETVKDPATAELLAPKDHPIGTKRLCVDTDYFETFNRDNVTLVDVRSAPITAITETGIATTDAQYELDAIIFATGFDAMTGALTEIAIRGKDGQLLREVWSGGPVTYLGLMVAGFPNLFIVTGPGSPSVKSNMVCSIEQHVEWISQCIADLDARGATAIEADEMAQRDWVAHVNEVADATLFPRAASWYSGSNIPGKARVFMPYVGGIPAYRRVCDEVVAAGYRGFSIRSDGARLPRREARTEAAA